MDRERDPAELAGDPDVPSGIRYDPDLAVHEPARVPDAPIAPTRRRSPLLLLPFGVAALCVLVYLLFGVVANEGKRPADYLTEIRLHPRSGWESALALSRLLREARASRDPDLAPQVVAALDPARGDDPRLRRYLILALGELRDPRGLPALTEALADGDLETRLYAAWGLGALGDARAVPALRPLLGDDEPDLRKIAAYALGAIDVPSIPQDLRPLLNDPVEDVAWNAALALARHRDRSALPLLARMLDRSYLDRVSRPDADGRPRPLTEEQKEEAMTGALRSIAGLGGGENLALLRRVRDSDPSLRVRQAALEALEAIREGAPAVRDP
jgi:hypothetical protein